MRIGAKQAIYRYNMSEEEYYFRFVEAFENFGLERHIAEPLSPAASAVSREDKQAEPKAASKQTNYADIANAQAGSHIYFGSYEQDNDLYASVKPIEWRVLERIGNRILVISEYGLEDEPYNKKRASVTWETCTLRAWLNSDFLASAFTAGEQAMIPAVHVVNERNPKFGTDGGNDTQDKVFILSISEAKSFFPTKNDRMCTPTAYTLAKGCYANKDSGRCWWWLRSPGDDQGHVARMDIDGTLLYDGYFAARTTGAVRPALWIEI